MTAAQFITPSTSQLAAINAIQASVTASTHWTVNSTGTTTAGYKYVEVKPSNANSIYKDYRILFVERVNSSTSKNYPGNSPFNVATTVPFFFCPDGGASYCTFTPANIETGNPPYVGTLYRWTTSSSSTYQWGYITGNWTALWLYECEGLMWIASRNTSTSWYLAAIGNIAVPARESLVDYNEGGTEVGLPGFWQNTTSWSSTTFSGFDDINGGKQYWWYETSPGVKSTVQGTTNASIRGSSIAASGTAAKAYYTSEGGAIFWTFPLFHEVTLAANPGNTAYLFRGLYLVANMQTRTTIQAGSPATTIGYTYYSDDTGLGTSSMAFAFLNTP